MMNKKAQEFFDAEVLTNPYFLLLAGGSILATILGIAISKRSGIIAMPIWQIPIVLVVEVIASYIFASRMN